MRYLLTGGSGFIGTHLIDALLQDGETEAIEVLDLRPPLITDKRVRYIEFDIRNPPTATEKTTAETCFHLAAICREPGYEWDQYFNTNYEGTRRLCGLLDRCGTKNVVFTSTMMVFRAQEAQMEEQSLTAPDTAYGISKLLAEKELERWAASQEGRRLRIVRPGVVFGKGDDGNFTRLYRALKKRRFAYVGKKNTIKGCVYVKDVVRCLQFLAQDQGQRTTYNLVMKDTNTIQGICQAMAQTLDVPARWIPTVPYPIALGLGYIGEVFAALGLRTNMHHRLVQKLYYSTHLSSEALRQTGFKTEYNLRSALADWRADCGHQGLC